MPLDPIITVSLYPERYMRIARHARSDDDMIIATHILNASGEWVERDGTNTKLAPHVAYCNDTDSLRAHIAILQGYVDELEKTPCFEGIENAA